MFTYRFVNASMIPQNEKPLHFLLIGVFFQGCIFGLWDSVLVIVFLVICWMLVCGGFDWWGLVCDWWHFVFAFVFVWPLVMETFICDRMHLLWIEYWDILSFWIVLFVGYMLWWCFCFVSLFGVYVLMIDDRCVLFYYDVTNMVLNVVIMEWGDVLCMCYAFCSRTDLNWLWLVVIPCNRKSQGLKLQHYDFEGYGGHCLFILIILVILFNTLSLTYCIFAYIHILHGWGQ